MATKKDITQTGPKALRGIRNPDLYNQQSLGLSQEQLDNLQNLNYRATNRNFEVTHGHVGYTGLNKPTFYAPGINKDVDYGSSSYDKDILINPTLLDVQDYRFSEQSGLTQALNGVLKGTLLAGTTFVNGTVGLGIGLMQGIANTIDGDKTTSFWQGLWNNPINALMTEVNNKAEEVLPNYRSTALSEGPWWAWDNLTSANFIFDSFVKNMGFTIGAVYSGGIYTKAIDAVAKLIGTGRMGAATAETIAAGEKAMESARATKAAKATLGALLSAHAEATTEAYNTYTDGLKLEDLKIQNRFNEDYRKIVHEFELAGGKFDLNGYPDPNSNPEAFQRMQQQTSLVNTRVQLAREEADSRMRLAATMDGILNIPILWVDNLFMMGKYYAGGWKAARNANKTVTRATKEAMKDAKAAAAAGDMSKLEKLNEIVAKAEKTAYKGLTAEERALVEEVHPRMLGKVGGATKKALTPFVREGNEEMSLGAASQASIYRYGLTDDLIDRIFDGRLDPDALLEVKGLLESLVYGIGEFYGDPLNWQEGFIGGLTGLLGVPTFGKRANSTDQTYLGRSKWIGLTGGAVSEVKNYLKERSEQDADAVRATEVLRKGNLTEDLKHLVAQTKFTKDLEFAVIHDDEKEYKDARTAAIFELIAYLRKVGRMDLLESLMNQMEGFTEEDALTILDLATKEVSVTAPNIQEKVNLKKQLELELELLLQLKAEVDSYGATLRELLLINALDAANEDLGSPEDNRMAFEMLRLFNQAIKQKQDLIDILDSEIREAKATTISPYVHWEDGSMFSNEEILQDLNKRVKNVKKIIDTINLAQDLIDEATSEVLTDEQLNTLTWYHVMMNDWVERSEGITTLWLSLILKIVDDPQLKAILDAAEAVEDILKESGLDFNSNEIKLGGRFDASLTLAKQYKKLLDNLIQALNTGGMTVAYLLTSEDKVKGTDLKAGELIMKQLLAVLNTNESITADVKENFNKALLDLQAMGKSHRRYNELLDEYLKNPEKIDEAHAASTKKAEEQATNKKRAGILQNINWEQPIGKIAKLLAENANSIQDAGGFDELIKELSPEELAIAEQVQKALMTLDAVNDLIDKSLLTLEHANILRKLLDRSIEDLEDPENLLVDLLERLNDGGVDDIIDDTVPEDAGMDEAQMIKDAAILAINDFLEDNLDEIVSAVDEAEKAELRRQEEEEKRMQEEAEALENKEKSENEDLEEPEEKDPADIDDTIPEDESEDELSDPIEDTTLEIKIRNRLDTGPQQGLNWAKDSRRRQISLYYLHGEDKQELPDYYELHPEYIPKGVDKEAFLKYVKAVHKYLTNKGAYTYISGVNSEYALKVGDDIEFITDKELNAEAGVTVILMLVTNKDELKQIIGSLATSLDFQTQDRENGKTLAEKFPGDKALYDALVRELLDKESGTASTITTKVEALKGGYPSFSKNNNSVASVFGDNPIPIAIVKKTSVAKSSNVHDDAWQLVGSKPGQVYVYIESNNGIQVPLLCTSTALRDLSEDDWYILQTLNAVLALKDTAQLGRLKMNLLKWLPFLKNLHINIIPKENNVKLILFSWGSNAEGKNTNLYSITLEDDGSIPEYKALYFIKFLARTKIETSKKDRGGNPVQMYPTTSVDRLRLDDAEYVKNISRYIKVNITENTPHTINDWFTYEATSYLTDNQAHNNPNPVVPTNGARRANHKVDTPDGEVEVSPAGTVNDSEGKPLDEDKEAAAREFINDDSTEVPEDLDNDDDNDAELSPIATKRRTKGSLNLVNIFRRSRTNRTGKHLLTTDTLDNVTDEETLASDEEKLRKMFPKLAELGRIVLVDGLISIIDNAGNPKLAYGLFRNGVLYISKQSPAGTAYHEAFHYVIDTLLKQTEKAILFKEATELFGNLEELELEEKLAESFREFMNGMQDPSIKGRLKSIWLNLKHIVKSITGRESYMDNLFWQMYRNKIGKRQETQDNQNTYKEELLKYKQEKLKYDNLDLETQLYIQKRGFSKVNFDDLSIEQKENVLLCM